MYYDNSWRLLVTEAWLWKWIDVWLWLSSLNTWVVVDTFWNNIQSTWEKNGGIFSLVLRCKHPVWKKVSRSASQKKNSARVKAQQLILDFQRTGFQPAILPSQQVLAEWDWRKGNFCSPIAPLLHIHRMKDVVFRFREIFYVCAKCVSLFPVPVLKEMKRRSFFNQHVRTETKKTTCFYFHIHSFF